MASSSNRRSGSSGSSRPRRRVVIDAEQTKKVDYRLDGAKSSKGPREPSRARRDEALTHGGKPAPSRQAKRVSAAKRDERERRQRMLRVRRSFAAIVALAVLTGLVWGAIALTKIPAFGIQTVRVDGARHLDSATVLSLARVPEGSSIIWLNKRAIERRVMANPWVAGVTIDRDLPDAVRIHVTERVPAIAVDTGGNDLWIVSTDGRWLGERSATETGVPVVRDVQVKRGRPGSRVNDPEVKNVLRIVAGLSSQLLEMTRFISAPTIEKTALITNSDVQIFVGSSEDIGKKDRIVREILKAEKDKVLYINVRVVDSPTWRGLEK